MSAPWQTLLVLVLAFVIAGCEPAHTPVPPAEPKAPTLRVAYREPANLFEIMDNVSSWRDGKCDPAYRRAYAARFGVTAEDEAQLAAYAAIRARTYGVRKLDRAGLFAPRKSPDRMALAFYAAETVAAALDALRGIVSDEDRAKLALFYRRFQPRIRAWLTESRAFIPMAKALEARLDEDRARSAIRDVAAAYGVSVEPQTVLYTWRPDGGHTSADGRGAFILLKYHPVRDAQAARNADGVVVHELAHSFSARQPAPKKRELSVAFSKRCAIDKQRVTKVEALEEPLAVAYQRVFEATRGEVDLERAWYGGHPWVGPLAKAAYALVRRPDGTARPLDRTLIERIAASCARTESNDAEPVADGPWDAEELTWSYDASDIGRTRVVVHVPATKERLPVLIAMHGLGEAMKGPELGARGWLDDYGLGQAVVRLTSPPLTYDDMQRLGTRKHLEAVNEQLAAHPYRGLIVVMPYTPDIIGSERSLDAGEHLAKFLVQTVLPRVYAETPAIGTPASTGIDGVSLGGRAALLVGLAHPDRFGAIGALQPALYDADLATLTERLKSARAKNPAFALRLVTSSHDFYRGIITRWSKRLEGAGQQHDLLVIDRGPHSYAFNRGLGVYAMLMFHDRALR